VGKRFVFTDEPLGQRPWLRNRVTKRFISYRHQAGLGHVRLHELRHLMATTMGAAGVPVPVVSGRLGPARTSVNVYAHAMPAPIPTPPGDSPYCSSQSEHELRRAPPFGVVTGSAR
jgi:integrase